LQSNSIRTDDLEGLNLKVVKVMPVACRLSPEDDPVGSFKIRSWREDDPVGSFKIRSWREDDPVGSFKIRSWREDDPVGSSQIRLCREADLPSARL